jgi:hypothetical protein
VRGSAAVLALLVAGIAFTAWALESSGVAVITTRSDAGERATHVWYVEDAGQLLVEAGAPGNGWFVDIQTHPRLAFDAPELRGRYVTELLPNPAGHERIRRLLREKYGVRDAWIALLFDTDHSIAVWLRPALP